MAPKPLIIGAALALVLPVLVIAAFNFRGPDSEPAWPNIPLLLGAWVFALSAPGFCAAYIARRRGWLYGAVLGLVPIAIALVARYEVPFVLIAALWVVAVIGGALGQMASRSRHAL